MKEFGNVLFGVAYLASLASAHIAIIPPFPDRVLTPNSTDTPQGCKKLSGDRHWPSDSTWRSSFPGIFKKLRGTYGPDWMLQATSVDQVQKAVNFAREHNVRLSMITTGHDFHGRQTARSGLRIDLATMRDPTVFSNDWKCGETLKPANAHGKVIDFENVQACKIQVQKRSRVVEEYQYFEKRDGLGCDDMIRLHKRQHEGMEGMGAALDSHGAPITVPAFNKIQLRPGQTHAYARIPAGIFNEMFFTQAHESGLMTLGAQHNGVSVIGGWFQAGGHNPFSNKFGLQVDNVVEVEVVTADGKFHKVSECNNPELFWALRGGGGGTFGVVTGATVKVFPTFPVAVTRFFVNSTSKEGISKASAHFLQKGAELRDKHGLQGYFYIYPRSFQSVLHMPDRFATPENAKAVTEPLMKKMEELAGSSAHIEPKYFFYKSYKDWYNGEMGDEEMEDKKEFFESYFDGSDGSAPSMVEAMMNPLLVLPWYVEAPQYPEKRKRATTNWTELETAANANLAADPKILRSQPLPRHYLDSRLLSNEHVNSVSLPVLAKAVHETMPNINGSHYRGFLYGGGKQFEYHADSVGVTPAWRNATYHFIINAVPGSAKHDYSIAPIAKLFPDAGAYVNEASVYDPEWKRIFWGSHYDRLEKIKTKYDPEHVFWCTPCVGADYFTYDDERICKSKEYPQTGMAPQTLPNAKTKVGISSLPGIIGIPHPYTPIIEEWAMTGKLPATMPRSNYFKIAMGEGGSAGGKFKDMDPFHPGQKLTVDQLE